MLHRIELVSVIPVHSFSGRRDGSPRLMPRNARAGLGVALLISTVDHEPSRLWKWARIARETIEAVTW